MIATISKPPDVPEYFKMRPTPTPVMTPPKIVESKILSVNGTTGNR